MIIDKQKIFVIYTTKNKYVNNDSLLQIHKELKEFGDVFIDLLHNDSNNKQEYVMEKLHECSFIVIVDTPELETSEWAQLEIKIAKKENKKIFGYYKLEFINNIVKLIFTHL